MSRLYRSRILIVVLIGAPILFYFLMFVRFSVDIPFGDDYAVLSFVVNFTNPHVPGKLPLLFSQHNEHRIVTLRLVALVLYSVAHRIDFRSIALLGNLGLLVIAWLIPKFSTAAVGLSSRPASQRRARLWPWLPVVYLLFQPQHHEILKWAMCSFTNVYVILFSFLAIYFLGRSDDRRSFAMAVGLSILAAYTNGNGVFVFLIGLLLLLIKKRFRRLAWWVGIGVFYIGFYFRGYVKNPDHPDALIFLKTSFLKVVEYFFSVLGSFADFGKGAPLIPITVGILVFLGLLLALKKKIHKKNVALTSLLGFLVLSLMANALTRAPLGLYMAFMPRYKFLSILMLILLYQSALELSKRKELIIVSFTLFAVAFGVYSFARNYATVRDNKIVLRVNMREWDARKADLPYPNPEHAETILRLAAKRHIYQPPPDLNIRRPEYPFGAVDGGPDVEVDGRDEMIFSGWALDNSGRPSVIVRSEAAASEPGPSGRRDGRLFLGKAVFKNESILQAERSFYGFPGTERMIWEFRFKAGEFARGLSQLDKTKIFFYARDRIGQETLIGTRTIRSK
ncbi:MAG: hypothetical protein NTU60_07905 [Candidatus Aminicenantes bacterium]|nr:hypothetical protein [Candidatus Aminicenantes bacterium]